MYFPAAALAVGVWMIFYLGDVVVVVGLSMMS